VVVVAITGVHTLLYTSEPEALRAVLRDVFGWPHVDAGGGWLIFSLPPAEMGVHPADASHHEVSFMCDDIEATVAELQAKGITFEGSPQNQGFGITVTMLLPGGVKVMLYQPRHPTAP
jgi:catechol 2,3-dioxygenase-like lactoylglutathione lyase family enzyme